MSCAAGRGRLELREPTRAATATTSAAHATTLRFMRERLLDSWEMVKRGEQARAAGTPRSDRLFRYVRQPSSRASTGGKAGRPTFFRTSPARVARPMDPR